MLMEVGGGGRCMDLKYFNGVTISVSEECISISC